MKLLNCMFGKGRGGLEQAAFDYHEALALAGIDLVSVVHEDASIIETFEQAGASFTTLKPFAEWDPFAVSGLKKLAEAHKADAVIAHGNRAIGLALAAVRGRTPVIGVAHNYNVRKRFPKVDAAFCITDDLIVECEKLGLPRDRLFHIPNLTRLQPAPNRTGFRTPPVIGTMGRFVEKKGMALFTDALHRLASRGLSFQAIIGGQGELEDALKAQAEALGLADRITFSGWVHDKSAFYDQLDVFVLPSHHEPFGIVLIEAMGQALPCITTATEGPLEIVSPDQDAILIEKNNPDVMADKLAFLILHPDKALAMGRAGRQTVENRYTLPVVSARLAEAVSKVVSR